MIEIQLKSDEICPSPDELRKMLDELIKESETPGFKSFLSIYAIIKTKH